MYNDTVRMILEYMATIINSFDTNPEIYGLFAWIGPGQKVRVSSNKGILEQPTDVSDRAYLVKSMAVPWKIHIGDPIEGRVSEKWIIPLVMGLTDNRGKYLGTLVISLDIDGITRKAGTVIGEEGLSFAILNESLTLLTQVSGNPNFLAENFSLSALEHIDLRKENRGVLSQASVFTKATCIHSTYSHPSTLTWY